MSETPRLPDAVEEIEEEEIRRRGFVWRSKLEARALHPRGDGPSGRFAYRLRDEQRVKNVARVPQAMVKVIPGGGVGSRGELVAQLNYLSRDGGLELEQGIGPDCFPVIGQEEIGELATDWALAWEDAASRDGRTARAKSKSFHMLVSYPEGTDPDMARMAADAFAERLCQSGDYGDRWRFVRAWHTDRAHPHMHMVIDRLGASGRMMQIHPAKPINPKVLRALQVETANEYGIELNDTPRVSRGHRDLDLSTAEWRANERGEMKGRSVKRKVYAKTAQSYADDAIAREAVALCKLSERMQDAGTPERRREARALERAAFTLMSGGTLDEGPGFVRETAQEPKPESVPQEQEYKLATSKQTDANARAAKREAEHAGIERQWKRDHQRQEQQAQERHRKRMQRLKELMRVEERDGDDGRNDARPSAKSRATEKARDGDRVPDWTGIVPATGRAVPKERNTPDMPVERPRKESPDRIVAPMSERTDDSDTRPALPDPPEWTWQGFDSLPRAPEDGGGQDISRAKSREQEQEPRRPLSEKELREVLQRREREMTEQERQHRQREGPGRGRERGDGYGFD